MRGTINTKTTPRTDVNRKPAITARTNAYIRVSRCLMARDSGPPLDNSAKPTLEYRTRVQHRPEEPVTSVAAASSACPRSHERIPAAFRRCYRSQYTTPSSLRATRSGQPLWRPETALPPLIPCSTSAATGRTTGKTSDKSPVRGFCDPPLSRNRKCHSSAKPLFDHLWSLCRSRCHSASIVIPRASEVSPTISPSVDTSSIASANRLFSLAFSAPRFRSRFASDTSSPPYFERHL